jgi:hypothetical protein
MAWIIIEGIDRSGKSSVSELYRKKGFEVIHMGPPDKRYFKAGYSGPSYLEEMVDLYNACAGKDIIFDRSPYGELVWPEVFNRNNMLSHEDIEYLQSIEYNNDTVKILMYDENKEAHWQRCVSNKEPIDRRQFLLANRLYEDMANRYNFDRKQLKDFKDESHESVHDSTNLSKNKGGDAGGDSIIGLMQCESTEADTEQLQIQQVFRNSFDKKLERANAIRELINVQIIKKKGVVFSEIESEIKNFLQKQLENIFLEQSEDSFTDDEVKILKIYAQRIKDRMHTQSSNH